MKLTTTRTMRYRGDVIAKGSSIEVKDDEARELINKKYATREVVTEEKRTYKRRDMVAEQAPEAKPTAVGAVTTDDYGPFKR